MTVYVSHSARESPPSLRRALGRWNPPNRPRQPRVRCPRCRQYVRFETFDEHVRGHSEPPTAPIAFRTLTCTP